MSKANTVTINNKLFVEKVSVIPILFKNANLKQKYIKNKT
jgi:hypothetical protein